MITGRPRTLRSGFSLPEPAADTVNREPPVDQLIDMLAWLPLALWGTMGGTVLGLLAGGLLLRLFAPRSVEPPEFGDPADFTVVDFEFGNASKHLPRTIMETVARGSSIGWTGGRNVRHLAAALRQAVRQTTASRKKADRPCRHCSWVITAA